VKLPSTHVIIMLQTDENRQASEGRKQGMIKMAQDTELL